MAKIAIIDDAIQDDRLENPTTAHYCLKNGLFEQAKMLSYSTSHDTHGTLVAKVLQTYAKEYEMISIQILDDWFAQRTCSADRLISALKFCGQIDVDLIHCSIGTERLSRIRQIRKPLDMLSWKKIPIIAAGSNARYRTIPASCSGVFGVMYAENSPLPPGAFAFAGDSYLGTELIANYELFTTSNMQYAKSSSLAAPVVTAKVNDLLNRGIGRSFDTLTAELQCCAWSDNTFGNWKERSFRAVESVPVAYLVDVFAQDGQSQIDLLDVFARYGYEAVGITGVSSVQDVRLLCYRDLREQSPKQILMRMLASTRVDLLIVFLTSADIQDWQQEIEQDPIVLYQTELEDYRTVNPHQVYIKLIESF